MELDPNDSRPPYLQVAHALRAAILTGVFKSGDQLPSGNELATQYGVARMTIQHAIRVLRDEGLVVSRQGSGVYVRERQERTAELTDYITQAFRKPTVSVDFAGLSGETLRAALQEPIEMIRTGRVAPESVAVRILVPDTSIPWSLPTRVDDAEDEEPHRRRIDALFATHIGGLADDMRALAESRLVADATVNVRTHNVTPSFKLYLINNEDAFFGFYPVYRRTVETDGRDVNRYGMKGKDAQLFHHDATGDSAAYFIQARSWFDSVWHTLGRERPL